MKKLFVFLFVLIGLQAFSQFGFRKWYISSGITGQYLTTEKYTGYDINLTYIPRYNFYEISHETTLSIEARPQLGVGFRNWHTHNGRHIIFPTRISYTAPVLLNFNWGLNSEENSWYLVGFYLGGGYTYSNVFSIDPPYKPVYGIVIDAGVHMDASPISHLSLMYTIGNDGSRIYSFGFYYDF